MIKRGLSVFISQSDLFVIFNCLPNYAIISIIINIVLIFLFSNGIKKFLLNFNIVHDLLYCALSLCRRFLIQSVNCIEVCKIIISSIISRGINLIFV